MRLLWIFSALLLVSCASKPPATAEKAAPAEPEVSVATTVAFTEGPAQGPDGMLYFTDVTNNRILRYNPQARKHEVFRADSNRANGLLFDADGRLIACEGSDTAHDNPRVTRTDLKTGKVEAIATQFEGKPSMDRTMSRSMPKAASISRIQRPIPPRRRPRNRATRPERPACIASTRMGRSRDCSLPPTPNGLTAS